MSTTRVPRTKPAEPQAGERDPMSEAMFLQIHGGDSSTMRMIELPAGPIRVGRGPQCEVRLSEPVLADVQCILRLRGNTWHYQPVGPSGRVWIDGRPAEDPRNLAQGVPFRVGDHWLTLRSARNAFNDWVAPDEPVPVVPDPSIVETPERLDPEPEADATSEERPRSTPTADENEERLRRWQARLEQRERWLKDRQDERRWEARWKSAGESIRARSTGSASPTREPVQKSPSRPVPTPRPVPAPASKPTPRPILTPPVSRIIETRPSEPTRRVAEPSSRPSATRPTFRPLPEPSLPRRPVETQTVRVPFKPTIRVVPPATPSTPPPPISRAMVTLPSTKVEWPTARIKPEDVVIPAQLDREPPVVVSPEPEPIALVELAPVVEPPVQPEVERVAPASFFETVEVEEIEEILAAEPPPVEVVSIEPEVAETVVIATDVEVEEAPAASETDARAEAEVEPIEPSSLESDSFHIESREEWFSTEISTPLASPTGRIEPSAWVDELPESETEEELEAEPPVVVALPTPVEREPAQPEFTPGRWVEPLAVEPAIEVGLPRSEYPSARVIFAAQGRRVSPTPAPVTSGTSRRRQVEPRPTDLQGPAQWAIPFWLGGLPAVAATLFLGTVGLALAYEWMVEAGASNAGLRMALRAETASSPLIDPASIPRGSWWFSNSTHLAAWAVALVRSEDGEDHTEDVHSLLVAAREASPLGARARFTIEAKAGSYVPGGSNEFSEIGRTRDIVSLSGTGRRLRESGKPEASIRAYRSAIEIALQADREGLDPPVFDKNEQVLRYALPHEALVALVVRNMAETGDWTIDQWTSVLPPSAVASWVASKVLVGMQKKAEGDALADLAIRQAEVAPLAGTDSAEHLAAVAEALAFRGRWTDASEHYRRAIDQVEDDAIRRSWWLNLSELAHRMSDGPAQIRAIEAAQSPDNIDEITTRARRYQESFSPTYSPGGRR